MSRHIRLLCVMALASASTLIPTLARAAAFDCARAALKVDFVICRSPEGLRAIAELQSAWDAVRQRVAPDQKQALVAAQREWIKAYSEACGLAGRGQPGPDPTLATDRCVAQQIAARAQVLRAMASNPDATGPEPLLARASADKGIPLQARKITPECALKPSVAVDPRPEIQAGQWLDVKWSRCASVARLEDPTFLILTVPDEVRLRGVGFYALRPDARAPFDFDVNTDKVRIVVPLHQPLMPDAGTVGISPLAVGDLPIEAAIFQHKAGKNVVTWRSGPMTKRIVPGTPDVSVWQEASSEAPKEVRDSDDGRWELRIYPQSYEVIDRRTGDLVVRRTGTRPAFSPTQRFLVADAPPREDEVSVYDLVARRVVLDHVKNFLLWLYQDSIALAVGDTNCVVDAYSTLVDANLGELAVSASACGASDEAWTGSKVDVSVDGGYVLSVPPDYAAAVFPNTQIGSLTRLSLGSQDLLGSQAVALVRSSMDREYSGPSKTWKLHDKIRFVSGDFRDTRENGRNFLITTSHVLDDGARSPLLRTAELREPITRGLTRDDRRGLERLDERGLARIDESRRSLLERSLQQMIGSARFPLSIATAGIEVNKSLYDPPSPPASMDIDFAKSNKFHRSVVIVHSQQKTVGGSDGTSSDDDVFIKLGNEVLRLPKLMSDLVQVVAWPQSQHDVAVATFNESGLHYSNYQTVVLRRRANGSWFMDADTEVDYKEGENADAFSTHHVAPKLYRFPSGDLVVLGSGLRDLLLRPVDETKTPCVVKGLRQSEFLQSIGMIGSDHLLTVTTTGDIDIYACPSGKHVISGALLDDELVVYTDEGWFDGSAEAASLVQLRMPGVRSRFPLARFEAALRRPNLLKDALDGKAFPPVHLGDPPFVSLGAAPETVEAGDGVALASVRFYDDGVQVADVPATGTRAVVPIPAEKLANARQAAAVAVDAAGVESAPLALPLAASTSRKGRLLGLTIGDDSYADPHIPPLGFAESDARNLADALARGDRAHLTADIKPLIGGDVTADAILTRLKDSIAAATKDDTLVFGFAGHGVVKDGELLLVLPNTDLAHLDTTALHWSAVEAALAGSPARVVVFLDACHSGSAALGSDSQNEAAIERLKNGGGPPMLIFAASKTGQVAGESASKGGGYFTAALVKTLLRDRPPASDGVPRLLRLNELYASVKREVLDDSDGLQIPWFGRRGLLGDFVMF